MTPICLERRNCGTSDCRVVLVCAHRMDPHPCNKFRSVSHYYPIQTAGLSDGSLVWGLQGAFSCHCGEFTAGSRRTLDSRSSDRQLSMCRSKSSHHSQDSAGTSLVEKSVAPPVPAKSFCWSHLRGSDILEDSDA
jgi:hypothetical protein